MIKKSFLQFAWAGNILGVIAFFQNHDEAEFRASCRCSRTYADLAGGCGQCNSILEIWNSRDNRRYTGERAIEMNMIE